MGGISRVMAILRGYWRRFVNQGTGDPDSRQPPMEDAILPPQPLWLAGELTLNYIPTGKNIILYVKLHTIVQ